jgi:chaperonin GroES
MQYELISEAIMSEKFKGAIRPLYDRVLVKRLESEQKSAGGIIIPDTAQEKTQYGTVIAAGEGKLNADGSLRALKIAQGDQVLFGKFSGTEVKVAGEDFLILREEEILGKLEQ